MKLLFSTVKKLQYGEEKWLEESLNALNEQYEQVNERLNKIEVQISSLQKHVRRLNTIGNVK